MQVSERAILDEGQSKILSLIFLFIMQLGIGLGSLAFFVIGITYIDDNSKSVDSPAAIAIALGANILGLQFGSALSLCVGSSSGSWWIGWTILAPLVFTFGMVLGLFPRQLVKTVIHNAAQRIIEETSTAIRLSTYIDDPSFWPSLKRLFLNKLLVFNCLSIMFIQGAFINFNLQEENYLQSRFYMPVSEVDGLLQEWNARFISYFLKPPVAAVSILVGGLAFAKVKLSAR